MEILDCSQGIAPYANVRVQRFDSEGLTVEAEYELHESRRMNILVNGRPRGSIDRLPEHIVEAALGYLFVQGELLSKRDVAMVNIGQGGKVVYVHLARMGLARPGFDRLVEPYRKGENVPERPAVPVAMRIGPNGELDGVMDSFECNLGPTARKRGVHSCALAADGEVLFQCFDVEPGGAMEKAIGYGFMCGIDMARAALVTNEPLDVDIVARAVFAGASCLAFDSMPSAEALGFARATKLTLASRDLAGTCSFIV